MWAIIVRKLVYLVITVILILSFNFFLFRIMPGDPARSIAGHGQLTEEQRETVYRLFGLDQPLHIQFLLYLRNCFTGQLGYSFSTYKTRLVMEVVLESIKYTLILVGASTAISVIIGVILGIISAWKRGTKIDLFFTGSGIILYSLPTYWFGMLLIMIFSARLGLFPISQATSIPPPSDPVMYILDMGWHSVLPIATFALTAFADFALIMRDSLIDVLTEDYIVTAHAKGLRETEVLRRHAVPNAMLPVVTQITMYFAWVVAGAIMIEIVFTWPGIGLLTYQAIYKRDYPIIQAVFLVFTIAMIIANFIADILYAWLDPRVRF